ncbi:hypothetical protein C2845_PM05G34840 [Panicum miliaceum]|uniref:Integrase catalytic domain-containing protein n=1 Tax=Panicum miliaceum TaxID=4540 RepID=A0A3L6ST08_PANMI|nr:hypothetical protein C2845_PM05G34840 [Panicum miliaceum]
MSGARSAFAELDTGVHGAVRFGDGSTMGIEGRGTVLFKCKTGEHQKLTGVYHIPRLQANIISLGQLEEEKFKIVLEDGALKIWDPWHRLVAVVRRGANRLYVLNANVDKPVCLAARGEEASWRWHARYGQLGFQGLQKLSKGEMVRGLPRIEQVDQVCDGCLVGKQRRLPFPAASKFRAARQLELVHADLCGPVTPPTPGGKKLFLLAIDDMSRYMWLVLLAMKDEAATAIIHLQSRAEAEVGRKLGTLRTDRGGEFTARAFGEYCAGQGIQRHLTAPYTPQQNGVVERRNQTVLGMARCMLKAMNVPGRFWGEAVTMAVFVLNRAPTKALQNMTPYEAWYGHKPDVHFFRIFGCVAHVKVAGVHLRKLDDRSTPMVLIGYEPGTKAYRLYNPATDRVHVSRDVVFEEGRAWNWEEDGAGSSAGGDSDPFVVEYTYTPGVPGATPEAEPVPRAASRTPGATSSGQGTGRSTTPSSSSSSVRSGATPSVSAGMGAPLKKEEDSTRAPATPTGVEFVSPPSCGVDLDNDHDDGAPLRFRKLDDILANSDPVEQQELMMAVGDGEPANFEEARREQSWIKAMREEMTSIEQNSTWKLVDLPRGHKPIGLKWVFKLKRDEAGKVVKHKARLVAKGYVQQQGIDFDEVFAPVARMESVRMLLAAAAQEGWYVHHMDVKSAFLNGELKEEVYVQQPPGFVAAGHEAKVLKLNKALYGLRQAPRAWNVKLDSSLQDMGFTRCVSEHGMYTRGVGETRVVVGVYVDDLIITGSNPAGVEAFKEEMQQVFRMSDLGLLSFYLGIEVKQGTNSITLGRLHMQGNCLRRQG